MKFLRIVIYIVLAIGIVFLALGVIAPHDYHVERTAVVNSPKEAVFPHVRDWAKWRAWSPWAERDPSMKFVITGKDGTVGSTYIWTGDPKMSGQGKMENIGVKENEEMAYHLSFLVPFESEAFGYFRVKDVPGGTQVAWGFHAHYPFPQHVMLLFANMEEMLAKDFDHGLARLKQIVEK